MKLSFSWHLFYVNSTCIYTIGVFSSWKLSLSEFSALIFPIKLVCEISAKKIRWDYCMVLCCQHIVRVKKRNFTTAGCCDSGIYMYLKVSYFVWNINGWYFQLLTWHTHQGLYITGKISVANIRNIEKQSADQPHNHQSKHH